MNTIDKFKIPGKVVIITGGAGMLGIKHAEAVIEGDGIPVLLDISNETLDTAADMLIDKYGNNTQIEKMTADITQYSQIRETCSILQNKYGHIDILINNAANNPKMESPVQNMGAVQFENFSAEMWMEDIAVGLSGAFFCSQIFGAVMAEQKAGVILNISSDLGIIAPDQRIYRKEYLSDEMQTVKPVSYSVVKHGLLGLTKYLATYYAQKGIRCNALCPGGVYNGQDDDFLEKITNLIPLGRMAEAEEYKCTILYMISEASKYMTGSIVVVDGGRTCW